jgi:hypothetical protein
MPDVGRRFKPTRPQTSDTFSSAKLGPQWEWNHNPDDRRWSLSARPGFLRLTGGSAINLVSARNTLTQALQSREAIITVRLDAKGLVEGQRAGLAMFGAGIGAIGVIRKDGENRIVFSLRGVDTLGPRCRPTRSTCEWPSPTRRRATATAAMAAEPSSTWAVVSCPASAGGRARGRRCSATAIRANPRPAWPISTGSTSSRFRADRDASLGLRRGSFQR